MTCIDWTPFFSYVDADLLSIKMKLNTTFNSILTDLDDISLNSRRYIELRLQDHIVSIADYQRKIARMHRQLSVASELLSRDKTIEYSYEKMIYMILFGILVGMIYERFAYKFILLLVRSRTI
jgi:hypothetical protein